MTQAHAKQWTKEIEFWGNGGSLWYYNYSNCIWVKHDRGDLCFKGEQGSSYIIEDVHFGARKAFALGEPIEFRKVDNEDWEYIPRPRWVSHYRYRPKREPEVKELTVAEISEKLGYEVKIVKG